MSEYSFMRPSQTRNARKKQTTLTGLGRNRITHNKLKNTVIQDWSSSLGKVLKIGGGIVEKVKRIIRKNGHIMIVQ